MTVGGGFNAPEELQSQVLGRLWGALGLEQREDPRERDPGGSMSSSLVPFPCSIQCSQAAISLRPGKSSPFVWRVGHGWAAKGLPAPLGAPSPGQAHRLAAQGVLPATGC